MIKPRLKFSLATTLLLWLVLILTAWNTIRSITGIVWRDTLATHTPYPGHLYIAITGAFWTLVGLFLLWSWWHGKRFTRAALLISSGLYTLWSWVDRFFVQNELRANWPFDLVVTILLLAFSFAAILNPKNLIYFQREAYERESESHPSA